MRSRGAAEKAGSPEPADKPTSRIPGFYRLSPDERLRALVESRNATPYDVEAWRSHRLRLEDANAMVENVIGTFELPNAVAVNFRINGVDRIVPLVVEEPSVVAAVSNIARLVREAGGFVTDADEPVMIGQIQLADVRDPEGCVRALQAGLPRLAEVAQGVHPRLNERGGGLRGFEVRRVTYDEPDQPREEMVVLHVHLDCRDAMGANMVNTLAERLAPHVEELTGQPVGLRILSNLTDRRMARAQVRLDPRLLGTAEMNGDEVARGIVAAWRFAWADPYRAATHNKGVMNGIDALAIATGNDWRAIEAGAQAWCCRDGQYRPMTRWRYLADGSESVLEGTLELPLAFATVGGPIKLHPTVQANLRLLGVTCARELSAIAAAVGLCQNLGALRALSTEGIQAGHMRMHARCVAATAGAAGPEVDRVAARLVDAQEFTIPFAEQVLRELRG